MSKYDKLDETFDIEPTEIEVVEEKKIDKIKSTTEDIKKDYEYTRGNLYSIIEKGQESSSTASSNCETRKRCSRV